MKINFKDEDKTLFFNLVSIFKQFGEIKELQNINPPISSLDLIIKELARIIVAYKFFDMNFSTEDLKPKVMFLLGTGNYRVDYISNKATDLFPEMEPGYFFEIKINDLWAYLKENGLET